MWDLEKIRFEILSKGDEGILVQDMTEATLALCVGDIFSENPVTQWVRKHLVPAEFTFHSGPEEGAHRWASDYLTQLRDRPGYTIARLMHYQAPAVKVASLLALDRLVCREVQKAPPFGVIAWSRKLPIKYSWLWVRIYECNETAWPLRAAITACRDEPPVGSPAVPKWLPQFYALTNQGDDVLRGPTMWERLSVEWDEG